MRKFLLAFMTVLAVLVSPVVSHAADLTSEQLTALREVSSSITTAHEMSDKGLISKDQAAAADKYYAEKGKAIVGHDITAPEIQKLVSDTTKAEGLNVFLNIALVGFGILLLLGVVGTFAWLLKDLLAAIPAGVYEILAYGATAFGCFLGYMFPAFTLGFVHVDPFWFVVPSAMAVFGCLFMTDKLHFAARRREMASSKSRPSVMMGPGFINYDVVMFAICTGVWAAMALFYHHLFPAAAIPYILGFMAVMALQAALGFSAITMPGCVALGWTEDSQIPRSIFASFLILAGYVVGKLVWGITGDWMLFEKGAIFMGALVYYIGLLVVSNKYFIRHGSKDEKWAKYLWLQALTIVSGLAALYLGSVYGFGSLLGIGGTLFAIYLLEKWYEIPWKGLGWPLSFIGVALAGYWFVGFAQTHSEWFLWGVK